MLASGFVKAEHSKAFLLTTVQGITALAGRL
jgi:hypothetical protein